MLTLAYMNYSVVYAASGKSDSSPTWLTGVAGPNESSINMPKTVSVFSASSVFYSTIY